MHIPDGYLSPATCLIGAAVMLPIWAISSKKVKETLKAREVPYLAVGSAFSFVIMMVNIPIPGGSTGHGVGGVLLAVLLGPWAACIAVCVALVIQALLFGDGGITCLGINCLNMAFILPFAGYYIYRLISAKSPPKSNRRWIAAAIGAYAGICMAALCAGIELGVQALLYHKPDGQALYCPYGLSVSIPAMFGSHVMVFGWVDFVMAGMIVKFLQKQDSFLIKEEKSA
ncbi:MAG: cobalt transporter CbiM [Candidatus Omnitrophica bacterium]|nr:cobalt transporter CbiM [Candidatus Omnitrophota bacterium]